MGSLRLFVNLKWYRNWVWCNLHIQNGNQMYFWYRYYNFKLLSVIFWSLNMNNNILLLDNLQLFVQSHTNFIKSWSFLSILRPALANQFRNCIITISVSVLILTITMILENRFFRFLNLDVSGRIIQGNVTSYIWFNCV